MKSISRLVFLCLGAALLPVLPLAAVLPPTSHTHAADLPPGLAFAMMQAAPEYWLQQARLANTDSPPEDTDFGWAVDIDGDTALVSTMSSGNSLTPASGKAYSVRPLEGSAEFVVIDSSTGQRVDPVTCP